MPLCHKDRQQPDASQVVESFKLLYEGITLPDGTVFKAAVAELRGDWKFQVAFCPELASWSFDLWHWHAIKMCFSRFFWIRVLY